MSATVLYCFEANGTCTEKTSKVQNAWRGAMAIWRILEKKYLPQYRPDYIPDFVPDDMIETWLGYKFSRTMVMDQEAMKDIWGLFDLEKTSLVDKIVLGTTFDYVLVRRENIQTVIECFEAFEKEHQGETNLKGQADALRAFLEDEEVYAVGWNQTSVNSDDWSNAGEIVIDENGDEVCSPYNFVTGKKHWWLFDALNETMETKHE